MATYEESGVNINLGDKCSEIAYAAAKGTFPGRKGMIGEPVLDEGGFTGTLDMGDYFLVQNDDGVGTKIQIAEKMNKFDTLGYDLVAMVADDAACIGAETMTVSNTIDAKKLDENTVTAMMIGLKAACLENKIVVPGGEIAELGNLVNGYLWNATAVGIVEKSKLITGEKIKAGDKFIGFHSPGFRSNGFSLVRHILNNKYGENWVNEKFDDKRTWGEVTLTPSKIYSGAILEMHGRYKMPATVELKGVCHITGGGIPGNLPRILKRTGLGAKLTNLPAPNPEMQRLMELGNVSRSEAYETWNMGVGMIIVCNEVEKVQAVCQKHGITMWVIGEVAEGGKIEF